MKVGGWLIRFSFLRNVIMRFCTWHMRLLWQATLELIYKTYQKILQNFYWPGLKRDLNPFCLSCHACQLVGKPNQSNLKTILALLEPFSQIIIDCVGPLPKTKARHQYLFNDYVCVHNIP